MGVCHPIGLSMYYVTTKQAIQLWKTGVPELLLHKVKITGVQGLDINNHSLFKQRGAVGTFKAIDYPAQKDTEHKSLYHYYPTTAHIETMIQGSTLFAKLCAHLRQVGFDDLSVQNFRHWLTDCAMDEDVLLMDMHERNKSNIHTYSSTLYDAIQNFLHPNDIHPKQSYSVQTTYPDQDDAKDDEKTE